jgi:hypothetical protein
VRTGFCVEALFGDAETVYRAASDEVIPNNGFGVLGADIAVPDGLRVDDDHGAVLALVEATGLVDAHAAGKASFLCQLLEAGVQIALAVGGTGDAGRIGGAGVVANKDVMFEGWQRGILLDASDSRVMPPVRVFRSAAARFPQSGMANPAPSERMGT